MFVRVNGGETVCLKHIQVINYDSFFLAAQDLTPHKNQCYCSCFPFQDDFIKEGGDRGAPRLASRTGGLFD